MRRFVLAGAAMLLVFAHRAEAQAVRLETRLVRQAGVLPGPIVDLDSNGEYTAAPGEVIRFEVQYRVIDLNLNDNVVPAGLTACFYALTSDASGYRFRRAQLSRFEAQLAAAAPPALVDASGLPNGMASGRRGLHAPMRNYPNTNIKGYPQNGTFINGNGSAVNDIDPVTAGAQPGNTSTEGDGIGSILSQVFTQSDQGNVNAGQDNAAWYGLYSIEVVAGTTDTFIRATVERDPVTGVAFGYFNDGIATPITTNDAVDSAYHITVPAPTAMPAIGFFGLGLARRRRRPGDGPGVVSIIFAMRHGLPVVRMGTIR